MGKAVTCKKCGRTKDEQYFYKLANKEAMPLCKDCITMHIDNFDPDTFMWVLQEADVPWIPALWKKVMDRVVARNPRLTGKSVIGRYLSQTKLKQFEGYDFAHSKEAQEKYSEGKTKTEIEALTEFSDEQKEYMKKQLEDGEISLAQYKTLMPAQSLVEDLPELDPVTLRPIGEDKLGLGDGSGADNTLNFIQVDLPDPADDLTDDDKVYLAMKWGQYYSPAEWVHMEQKYVDMVNSFGIEDSDSLTTLKHLCKCDLKMDQALNAGDVDGFNKLARTYDLLRKSAKWTANQNKEDKQEEFNCIGKIVEFCERNGGKIPRMELDIPLDVIDKVITDLKKYNYDLIMTDPSLGQQIETYLLKRKSMDEKMEAEEKKIAEAKKEKRLEDQDYHDFNEHITQLQEKDSHLLSIEEN